MSYFEANATHEHKMFAWKLEGSQNENRSLKFKPDESDVTFKNLIEPILRRRGSFESPSVPLPQHLGKETVAKPKNVHEKLCQWAITDWTADREVRMIRDLTMIFKLCMEPTETLAATQRACAEVPTFREPLRA